MAQVLKDEVRERIVAAALGRFAEAGWAGTTVASVAEAAGLSVGNLYRYFSGKEELLEAAIPREAAEALAAETSRKLRYLAERGLSIDEGGEALGALQAELAAGLWKGRELLAFLINGAEGSPREGFARRLAETLARAYAAWAASVGARPPRRSLDLVEALYGNLVAMAGRILRGSRDARAFAGDFGLLLEYHSRGMEALAGKWKEGAAARGEG